MLVQDLQMTYRSDLMHAKVLQSLQRQLHCIEQRQTYQHLLNRFKAHMTVRELFDLLVDTCSS
jgi:hypothetical protein